MQASGVKVRVTTPTPSPLEFTRAPALRLINVVICTVLGHLRYENLHYEVISERPRIFYYPTFLSHSECDAIREKGIPNLKVPCCLHLLA